MASKTGQKKDGRGTWWKDDRDGHGWSSGDKDDKGYHYHEHHVSIRKERKPSRAGITIHQSRKTPSNEACLL